MFSVVARSIGAATTCQKVFRVGVSTNLLTPVRTFQSIMTQPQGARLQGSTTVFKSMNLLVNQMPGISSRFNPNMVICRGLNRNARRPTKSNHGKRPVSHARKREKQKSLKSRLYRKKIFGFW